MNVGRFTNESFPQCTSCSQIKVVSQGWGHLITWNGPMMGRSEQLFGLGGGNLNKKFPKIQMPGRLPGDMFKLRSDLVHDVQFANVPKRFPVFS